ncbi:MAG: hypoxanthine-guanine phosphoribosyltransferase [Pseudohongiellaceae bacterium]
MTPEQIWQVRSRARCLYNSAEVEAALDRIACEIHDTMAQLDPVFLCVLNGGLIVAGRLSMRLQFPLRMGYLHATRYRDNTTGSELNWQAAPSLELIDETVLIVDDILDEGTTLKKVVENCISLGARKVYTAVLVDKQHGHKRSAMRADFVGLEAEDHYLFGYGMDFKGYLRNADGIYAVDDEDLRTFG